MEYYLTQPGFQDNPEGFSIQARSVSGTIAHDMLYCADIYRYTEDYATEIILPQGLYAQEADAQNAVEQYWWFF